MKSKEIILAASIIGAVLLMVFPLPAALLDCLLAINLLFSFFIFLKTLRSKNPLGFSFFPTILLVLSVYNLIIPLSSARLILTKGAAFDGRLILFIASLMSGSDGIINLALGFTKYLVFLLFLAMIVIKGTVRISEVYARFVLNNLPSKQMTIDAEYASGAITKEESMSRKCDLQCEVDFFGTMDGATKFFSGSFKAGIFITGASIIGGILIGTKLYGEEIITAAGIYIPLSVAAGFFTLFPILLISIAVGITITRLEPAINLFEMWGIRPFKLPHHHKSGIRYRENKNSPSDISDILSLELGFDLIPLVDRDKGAEFLDRFQVMRRQIALDLGIIVPRIRIIDSMLLEPSEYCLKIRGVDVCRGNMHMRRDEAEREGCKVVDLALIIAAHLTEVIKQHAPELLGRQEVHQIIDVIHKENPVLVDRVLECFTTGQIQQVLKNLAKEQISIRNMGKIMETMIEHGYTAKDIPFITEKVKQAMNSNTDEKD